MKTVKKKNVKYNILKKEMEKAMNIFPHSLHH